MPCAAAPLCFLALWVCAAAAAAATGAPDTVAPTYAPSTVVVTECESDAACQVFGDAGAACSPSTRGCTCAQGAGAFCVAEGRRAQGAEVMLAWLWPNRTCAAFDAEPVEAAVRRSAPGIGRVFAACGTRPDATPPAGEQSTTVLVVFLRANASDVDDKAALVLSAVSRAAADENGLEGELVYITKSTIPPACFVAHAADAVLVASGVCYPLACEYGYVQSGAACERGITGGSGLSDAAAAWIAVAAALALLAAVGGAWRVLSRRQRRAAERAAGWERRIACPAPANAFSKAYGGEGPQQTNDPFDHPGARGG
ncbi:hypothetical protein DIPPA_05115 [Diplonema papillatum]|nr:hypothetical protein DIPPA_05115 [Diplonema papillatum]